MTQLDELPVELQYYIFTLDASSVWVARRLNHFYRELVKWPYFRQFSKQPLRTPEIKTYLKTSPARFAVFNWAEGSCDIFTQTPAPSVWDQHLWSQSRLQPITYLRTLLAFTHNMVQLNLTLIRADELLTMDKILAKPRLGELDLLSQYEVCAARADLTEIQPLYPYHRIYEIIQIGADDYLRPNPVGWKNMMAVNLWIQIKVLDYLSGQGPLQLNDTDDGHVIIPLDSPAYQAIHTMAAQWNQLARLYF